VIIYLFRRPLPLLNVFLSGLASGAVVAPLVSPTELFKLRLQLQRGTQQEVLARCVAVALWLARTVAWWLVVAGWQWDGWTHASSAVILMGDIVGSGGGGGGLELGRCLSQTQGFVFFLLCLEMSLLPLPAADHCLPATATLLSDTPTAA
jgi:hypothetical protein